MRQENMESRALVVIRLPHPLRRIRGQRRLRWLLQLHQVSHHRLGNYLRPHLCLRYHHPRCSHVSPVLRLATMLFRVAMTEQIHRKET